MRGPQLGLGLGDAVQGFQGGAAQEMDLGGSLAAASSSNIRYRYLRVSATQKDSILSRWRGGTSSTESRLAKPREEEE